MSTFRLFHIGQVCERILRERGHIVDVAPSLPEPELLKRIGTYDAVVVRSATKVGDIYHIVVNLDASIIYYGLVILDCLRLFGPGP
jgi:phosphoglycerate dehydrogenase-like enzyme